MKKLKILLGLTTGLLSLLYFTSNVRAVENILFTDDFNDREIADWVVARNSQWSAPLLPCMNGTIPAAWSASSGLLKIDINSQPCTTELTPIGLDLSGFKSYKISFDWLINNGVHMDRNFAILWKDPQSWIALKMLDNTMILHRMTDGEYHIIPGSATYFNFENKSYHFTIIYENNNHIIVQIDGKNIIDVSDVNYSSPYAGSYTFAFQASVGAIRSSTSSFDNITVTSIDDTLGVNLLKQGQEPWGLLEYDSASQWATAGQGTTFKDWGCALTSAVMIMNFHGINQMPDGSPVTPLTLNNWLIANGGYFNGGNVSFATIAALTKKLSNQYGHVALEYSRNDTTPRQIAATEIAAGKPVIVTKPGHFMVADGVVAAGDDLYIKDPAFSYTKLSEHNALQTSTRLLTPSQTDVSFLEIATDPSTQVQIVDPANQSLAVTAHIEKLESDTVPGQYSPATQVTEVPKPGVGVYRIALNSSMSSTTPTVITTITPNGDITRHIVPSGETEALLSFKTDAPSVIEYIQPTGFSKLRQTILRLWREQAITHESLYQTLDAIAAIGEGTDQKGEQVLIVTILKRAVTSAHAKQQLTDLAKKELLQQLKELQADLKPQPTTLPTPQPKPNQTNK